MTSADEPVFFPGEAYEESEEASDPTPPAGRDDLREATCKHCGRPTPRLCGATTDRIVWPHARTLGPCVLPAGHDGGQPAEHIEAPRAGGTGRGVAWIGDPGPGDLQGSPTAGSTVDLDALREDVRDALASTNTLDETDLAFTLDAVMGLVQPVLDWLTDDLKQARSDLAHARSAGHAYRRRAERAERALRQVRRLHERYRSAVDDTTDYCQHCNRFGDWVPYPCPTLRAMDGTETT